MKVRIKRLLATVALLALAAFITGCVATPPQPLGGAPTATPTPDAVPAFGQAVDEPTALSEPIETAPTPPEETPPAAAATLPPAGTARTPSRVEVFYSGAFSMMGFADAPSTTIYENTMEALAACVSLCWPTVQADYYRYSRDMNKLDMRYSKELLLGHIGRPAFYRDTALTEQPGRVKTEEAAVETVSERMNEPVLSFYEAASLPDPVFRSNGAGTSVALSESDPNALTLIVTDLHELRTDDGAILSSLNQSVLSTGRSVGLVAIVSEFAGYIPDVGANKTAFLWGSPPSGTLDAMLDYEYYKVGVSVDPQARQTRPRPFYVLCLGDQAAVNTYIQTLSDRLNKEFQGNSTFQLRTALFGSSYVADGYELGGNLRLLSGQGVTAMADDSAPAGVGQVELKASQQTRALEWALEYAVHPSDPRAGSLRADDFQFEAAAVSEGNRIQLPDLSWSVTQSTATSVTLRLRLEFPQGILPRGDYALELSGRLAAPQARPGSEWVDAFGWDADGVQLMNIEQNLAPFDGSRTLFLSRLMDALGLANTSRLGGASLGTVSIRLTVYA